jgi:hypothetical protein
MDSCVGSQGRALCRTAFDSGSSTGDVVSLISCVIYKKYAQFATPWTPTRSGNWRAARPEAVRDAAFGHSENEAAVARRFQFRDSRLLLVNSQRREGAGEDGQDHGDVNLSLQGRDGDGRSRTVRPSTAALIRACRCNQLLYTVVDGFRVQSDRAWSKLPHMSKLKKTQQWGTGCGEDVAEASTQAAQRRRPATGASGC